MPINSIKFLTSDSVTATNGSPTIQVTGNVDCSNVYSGTAVFIEGYSPVEAISGTIPDGSGNSSITLRNNWSNPTVSTKMVAFNSIEGLSEAIRRAREVIANIDGADAQIQQQLSDINDNLVLIGDAPANATAAAASAAAAATSETNAATSATAAATSETNAATSAANAATSETNAATSETNAAGSATSASTSETNAGTSETNAATSATNAATSETNAGTSETNAAGSATAAATSATNAATSETNAATSETNAATSATNAANSEGIALAAANFQDNWSNLTGPLNIPASVLHNDNIWLLVQNMADVTTVEPGTNSAFWVSIGSTTGTSPNSLALGGETAAQWQTKIDDVEVLATATASDSNALGGETAAQWQTKIDDEVASAIALTLVG